MGEQESVGNAWGDPISEERKKELEQRLQAWEKEVDHEERKGPFDTYGLPYEEAGRPWLTGADVFWLAAYTMKGLGRDLDETQNILRDAQDGSEVRLFLGLFTLHLERANLNDAHLEGTHLSNTSMEGARLHRVSIDKSTVLNRATLAGAHFDQVMFDNANLTVVDWSRVPILGDEIEAQKSRGEGGEPKDSATRLENYQAAVRANRLLSLALRAQGLNEDADRYAYRAEVLQRRVLWRQAFLRQKGMGDGLFQRYRKLVSFGVSSFLDLIAGCGYRPGRSFITYIVVICTFAGLYLLNGQFASPHLRWDEALVLSISSFHGRGFFTSGVSLGDTLARLAAGEAILGLLLEITFIATFTNRFFAR